MTLQFDDIPSTGEEPLRLGVANAARNAERFSPDPNFADNDPARGYGNGEFGSATSAADTPNAGEHSNADTYKGQQAGRELRRRRDLGLEPIPGFPLRSRFAD